ncbi:hypothetical protein CES85_3994 [Ochrobactrum quorumnocens]|uniref:Uncharacterized protein n=1 Tax=Ochrobactrum quorumnocens TaxID=271865 RepID=A0A248U918_9HYPH|nr:hypothetical protein [[Ochrobactrum] quorumnocens]ASV83215.1 hypothetical protein CES85_3994 [[Ochrobactrum] quorumnocens]
MALTSLSVAERMYVERKSTYATTKIDLAMCTTFIADLKMFGEIIHSSCTPDEVLSLLRKAEIDGGIDFYG